MDDGFFAKLRRSGWVGDDAKSYQESDDLKDTGFKPDRSAGSNSDAYLQALKNQAGKSKKIDIASE